MERALSIRDARSEELDAIALMMRDAYSEYATPMGPEKWERYSRDITDLHSRLPISELIVAEEGGRLLGAVTYYSHTNQSAKLRWPRGWAAIRLLAVAPEGRGKGIGRVLMEECLRRSRQHGSVGMGLRTTELMTVAQGMYERMGFVRMPDLDAEPGTDDWAMAYGLEL